MIQIASFVGLAKTILIILLVYSVFKYVMRLITPYIIQSLAKKMANKFNQPYTKKNKKEGEVSIDKTPNTPKSSHDVGEYVDFEEVE